MAVSDFLLKREALTSFTLTLASLANASARQSTIVSNTTGHFPAALIHLRLKSGGSAPTAGAVYEVYLIRGDGTILDDDAGASDAAITIENARLLTTIVVTATINKNFYAIAIDTAPLGPLGNQWGIAIKNSSGQALNATEGDHYYKYEYYRYQSQ